MSRGELRCCGSPLYLKSMYGSGYNLIITRKNDYNASNSTSNDNTHQLAELVSQHVNNAKLNSEINSEISFVLPKEECSKFPDLLLDLETKKESLNIINIGISITTVEDVFLKIGELENVDDQDIKHHHSADNPTFEDDKVKVNLIQDDEIEIDDNAGLWVGSKPAERLNGFFEFYLQQLHALFMKRVIHSLRNKTLVISQIVVPMATLLIVLLYVKYGPIKPEDSPALEVKLSKYRSNFVPFQLVDNTNDSFISQLGNYFEVGLKTDENAKVFNLADNKTLSLCSENRSSITDFLVCVGRYSITYISDNYIFATTFLQQNDSDTDDISYQITGHFNNQPYHVPPLALNVISNTLLKYFTNNTNNTINVINHPLPRNIEDKISDLQLKDATGFNVATDLTFGFSFLVASFVVFLIKERVSGSKHIQYLSGANSVMFWVSALVWDFLNFLIPTALSIVIMSIFGLTQYTGGSRIWIVIGLFLFYGLAHIPQAYLISYLFSVPATGFAVSVAFFILTSQATLTSVGILQLPMLDLQDVADSLEWVFLIIFPNFAFGQGLADLYTNYQANQFCGELVQYCTVQKNPCCIGIKELEPNPCFPFDCVEWTPNYMDWRKPGLLRFFVFMPIQFLVQFSIILMYETGVLRRIFYKIQKIFIKDTLLESNFARLEMERLYGDITKDEDVVNEEKRIYDLDVQRSDDLLIIDNLTKYYSNFMAVKGVSLGIKSGETFGLLGVNGAGKSSTFKMLTGDEPITRGNSYLNKTSIKTDIKKVNFSFKNYFYFFFFYYEKFFLVSTAVRLLPTI